MNERIGEESGAPVEIVPAVTDNSLEIYKIKTDIAALNLRVQRGEYMPSGFADSKMKEYEDRIHQLEKETAEANKPIESKAISTEISEEDRLKKEIEWLNKSVQHGTDLDHDAIEKKVLANEARIRELEAGATPSTEIPPATPEPIPASVEAVPPTAPALEAAPVVTPTPEIVPPTPVTPEASPIAGVRLNPENQSRFSKMTEGAKRIATKLYEGIKNIPVVQETVGKMQIAYNQRNADTYENHMAIFKKRMGGLDTRIKSIEAFQTDARKMIDQGGPGAEALEVKIREMEQKKVKLQGQKDKNQSQFEGRDNKRKLYLEKRDKVADKLIKLYEAKLEPVEGELVAANEKLDQILLDIAVTEAKHQNRKEELARIEKTRIQIEEGLRASGEKERNIRKFEVIEIINQKIKEGNEEMKREEEELSKAKAKIKEEIAKIDEKANPFRDKRAEYVRIKNTRGANLTVEARAKEIDLKAEETISGHPRVDFEPNEVETAETTASVEYQERKKETQEFVSLWNEAIKENGGDTTKQIDLTKFTKETRFLGNEKMDAENFKNILAKYYKKNKIPLNTFIQDMRKFEEKLTK